MFTHAPIAQLKQLIDAGDVSGLVRMLDDDEHTSSAPRTWPADTWNQLWNRLSPGHRGHTACLEAMVRHASATSQASWWVSVFRRTPQHPWLAVLETHTPTSEFLLRATHLGDPTLAQAMIQRWGATWQAAQVVPALTRAVTDGNLDLFHLLIRQWPTAKVHATELAKQAHHGSPLMWQAITPHLDEEGWSNVGIMAMNIGWMPGLLKACAGLASSACALDRQVPGWWKEALTIRALDDFPILAPRVPPSGGYSCLRAALEQGVPLAVEAIVPQVPPARLNQLRQRLLRQRPPRWDDVDMLGEHVSSDLRARWVRTSGEKTPRTLAKAREEQAAPQVPTRPRARVRS